MPMINPPALVAQMQAPVSLTAAQFSKARAGSSVHLAIRVRSAVRSVVIGELLDETGDSTYRATGKAVRLYDSADTPVVMGDRSGVRAGAIVLVDAVATGTGRADAKRLTIITSYAKVGP